MKLQLIGFLLLALSTSINSYAQIKADDILGVWLTTGKEPAKIEIYKSGQKYYGKIIWLLNPLSNGKSKVDANNPVKNKRHQQIIGLIILSDFEFDDNKWDDGEIYDPESGKTYSCHLTLKDKNTLKVRGYIGVSLLGRTETWTKVN
jgi:uncharacterized protein (DUF2147 family)